MNKSSQTLHLDPFAAAVERKEREALAQQSASELDSQSATATPKRRESEKLVSQSTSQPVNQSTSQPANQSASQPVNQSTSQPEKTTPNPQETGQPVSQNPVSQSTALANQPTSEPADQSASEQLTKRLLNPEARYRSRVARRQKGLRLPAQKLAKWELWCFLNKMDFQEAVEKAMDWLTSQPVSSLTTYQFDDQNNGEIDEVIILYRRLTGNRWTKKDDEARSEVAQYAAHIQMCGVVLSLLRTKNRINSFRYCLGAIHEVGQANPGEDLLAKVPQ
jgi:hypothetical protein